MKMLSTLVYCLLIVPAVAAPTANEDFVIAEDAKTFTNAVAEAVRIAKDYTDGAIIEGGGGGNYAAVSNAAMNALSRAEAEAGFTEWDFTHAPSLIANNPELKWNVERGEWEIYLNGVYQTYLPGSIDDIRVNFGSNEYATRIRLPTMADIAAATNGIPRITESTVYPGNAAEADYAHNAGFADNAEHAEYATDADSASHSTNSDLAYHAYSLQDEDGYGSPVRTAAAIFSQLDAATTPADVINIVTKPYVEGLGFVSDVRFADATNRIAALEALLSGLESALHAINTGTNLVTNGGN